MASSLLFDPSVNPSGLSFQDNLNRFINLTNNGGKLASGPVLVKNTGNLTPEQLNIINSTVGAKLTDPDTFQSTYDDQSKVNWKDIGIIGGTTIGAGLLGGGLAGAGPLASLFSAGALPASAATAAGTVGLGGGGGGSVAALASLLPQLLGTGLSAAAGAFGAQDKGSTSSSQQTSSTATSTPNLSPEQHALINMIIKASTDQYNQDTDVSGYTANGLQNINNASNIQSKTVQNLLASRGLSYSPAAVTALANPQSQKLQQSSAFLNSVPQYQRQLKEQSLTDLMKSFGLLPTAVTTTNNGTNTGTGQQIQAGSPIAGALSGAGAGLYSSGLSSVLGNLFSKSNPGQASAGADNSYLNNSLPTSTMNPFGVFGLGGIG